MEIGDKILQRRKELGITQAELAEKMYVTRQTISRWELGAACPDIKKIVELAEILEVSCDYLLKGERETAVIDETIVTEEHKSGNVTRLLQNLKGKIVKITFYEEEEDGDVEEKKCLVIGFHGNWIEIEVFDKKENKKKILPVSSILSFEIMGEE